MLNTAVPSFQASGLPFSVGHFAHPLMEHGWGCYGFSGICHIGEIRPYCVSYSMFANYMDCSKNVFSKTEYVLCISCVSWVDCMWCKFYKFANSCQEILLKTPHHGKGTHWHCIHTAYVNLKTPDTLR